MRIRYVAINRDTDFADVEGFARHPHVVKCWRLPRAFTLYELYAPVFDLIWDPDLSNAARLDPEVRRRTNEVYWERNRQLAPLLRDVPDPNHRPMDVRAITAHYHFFGLGRSYHWPQLGTSVGWGEARVIRIAGRLATALPENVRSLQALFSEWADCMTRLGELTRAPVIHLSDGYFSEVFEFSGPCGDAAMALFMLVTDTRKLTSLQAIGFFHPEDYATAFSQRVGPGESAQRPKDAMRVPGREKATVGGDIWCYFVPYQPDIGRALQELRQREFEAGRYHPVQPSAADDFPGSGIRYATIEEALLAAGMEGTRSILDMERVGTKPHLGVVTPLAEDLLEETFGTAQPTRQMIESEMGFLNGVERGQGVYAVAYRDGQPSEIFFAGLCYH